MEPRTSATGPAGEARHKGWQIVLLTSDVGVEGTVAGILKGVGSYVSRAENADELSLLLSAMQFDAVVVDERHPDAVAVMELRKNNPPTACVVLTRTSFHAESGMPFGNLVSQLGKTIGRQASRERHGEPIDIQKFLARLGSDLSFFNSLAADLLDDLKIKIPELDAAVAAGDASRVEFLAHGLKSVLALFGAEEAASTARLLETAAHEGKNDDMLDIMPQFREELGSIAKQLRQVVPGN